MQKSDVTCRQCRAGYRRIELTSTVGSEGEFRCLLCDHVIEVFDGSTEVALRLTVQPEKIFERGQSGATRFGGMTLGREDKRRLTARAFVSNEPSVINRISCADINNRAVKKKGLCD